MNDLRTAAQQALAFTMRDFASLRDFEAAKAVLHDNLRAALAQQAEPVQEPVAWRHKGAGHFTVTPLVSKFPEWEPLYTAPPQRKPLTEEEILKAIGWERAEMYMKLTPNFPVAEAKKETLKNARAIERAHGIGETK